MEKVKIDKQWTVQLLDIGRVLLQGAITIALTLLAQQAKDGLGFDWSPIFDAIVLFVLTNLSARFGAPTKVVIEQPEAQTIHAAMAMKDPDNPGQPPHPIGNPIHPKRDTRP